MSYLCIVGFGTADRTPMNVKPLKHHLQMKATLNTILLSLLLSAGMASCTQSDETKEIAEIQESIANSEEAQAREKVIAEINKRHAQFKEREKKHLEKMVSTPEGRAEMEKHLLICKNIYLENNMVVFKLSREEALKSGITQEEYNQVIESCARSNHITDSLLSEHSNMPDSRLNISICSSFEEARNGTHIYYEYLKKYYNEHPDVPALRERK